jgi:transketolase
MVRDGLQAIRVIWMPDLIRMDILRECHENRMSHIGTSLSCVEILKAIYSRSMTDNDRVIISKGHGVAAINSVLKHLKGVSCFNRNEHTHRVPGYVSWTTGSLGHGISVGIGMAMAGRDVIVVCGDGELDEGSCWEALGFLTSHPINGSIRIIIDHNGWGGYGRVSDFLIRRVKGFIEPVLVDGHDMTALGKALRKDCQKKAIIAKTVKGKGVSFLEDTLKSHYTSLTDEEYIRAIKELEA